jgi:hypothetical protein
MHGFGFLANASLGGALILGKTVDCNQISLLRPAFQSPSSIVRREADIGVIGRSSSPRHRTRKGLVLSKSCLLTCIRLHNAATGRVIRKRYNPVHRPSPKFAI